MLARVGFMEAQFNDTLFQSHQSVIRQALHSQEKRAFILKLHILAKETVDEPQAIRSAAEWGEIYVAMDLKKA